MSGGPLGGVEARARQRFHRFSARAWQQWIDRSARPLAAALSSAPGWTDAEREALLTAAAELGAEAVGLGYLHVSAPGTQEGWSWHALGALLSHRLPCRPPREALEELAALWNLTEALERGAPWVRHLVSHFAHRLRPELSLAAFVRALDVELGTEGLAPLGEDARAWCHAWAPVAPAPSDALPGRVVFLAPRLVAVEVRGTAQASYFLLKPEPFPLGPGPWDGQGEAQAPFPRLRAQGEWLSTRRAGPLRSEARTAHTWVAVPQLSQRVLFTWRAT